MTRRSRTRSRSSSAAPAALVAAALLAIALVAAPAARADDPLSAAPALQPLGPGADASRRIGAPHRAAQAPAESTGFLRTAVSLAGVVVLILGCGAIVRTLARGRGGLLGAVGPGGRAPSGIIEVLGRYPIARGQRLVLLKIDRRVLLICQNSGGRLGAGGGCVTLCEITDPDEVASILVKTRDADQDSMAERFRSLLTGFGAAGVHPAGGAGFRAAASPPFAGAAGEGGSEGEPARAARHLASTADGDRVEVWVDRATAADAGPGDIFPPSPVPERPITLGDENGAVGSLRRRLAALRVEQGDPVGRPA